MQETQETKENSKGSGQGSQESQEDGDETGNGQLSQGAGNTSPPAQEPKGSLLAALTKPVDPLKPMKPMNLKQPKAKQPTKASK